jgi:hypothetical protein
VNCRAAGKSQPRKHGSRRLHDDGRYHAFSDFFPQLQGVGPTVGALFF